MPSLRRVCCDWATCWVSRVICKQQKTRCVRIGPPCKIIPSAHASLLIALEEQLDAPQLIIIRGAATECSEWQQALSKLYQPTRLVFAIPAEAVLPDPLASKASATTTLAYVCQGTTCSAPVQSLEALIALSR